MREPAAIHPAIMYEPDGYRTDGAKLMGRQAAGQGFLRAAVGAARGVPLAGYTVRKQSAESFARTVAEIDPQAKAAWLPPSRSDQLRQLGHLYVPGPGLGEFARQRMRAGAAAWSLTGVTHTTASHGVMDALADLPLAPVMPWDALICTSQAVHTTVCTVLQAQRDYLRWRLGGEPQWTLPQMPVIPLGVHCSDFEFGAPERQVARAGLKLADDEVVFLFVGRLSFHAKAHPHAMCTALQEAAVRTGCKPVLVQCGWFANEAIEKAFRECAALCPQVRCLFTDGRDDKTRRACWAAADVFVSLSDNIQETFGLTPIEAMAAGLPVVVTDWDGYKETVREGVDGFRIPTWMAPAGAGDRLAWAHEVGVDTYDQYCGMTCQHVAVDHRVLAQRFATLLQDAPLRRQLGAAGRDRAQQVFDWAVVYGRYQQLWAQLDELRAPAAAASGTAPRVSAARLDPFMAFEHYPTCTVAPASRVTRREGMTPDDYARLLHLAVFSYAQRELPTPEAFQRVWEAIGGGTNVLALAGSLQAPVIEIARVVSVLAKMGLVELAAAE